MTELELNLSSYAPRRVLLGKDSTAINIISSLSPTIDDASVISINTNRRWQGIKQDLNKSSEKEELMIFNNQYYSSKYNISGYYYIRYKSANKYLLYITNLETHFSKLIAIDFSKVKHNKEIFSQPIVSKTFRKHICIIHDTLYYVALNKEYLFFIQYDLKKNIIDTAFKTPLNSPILGYSAYYPYKMFKINTDLLITFANQVYSVSLSNLHIKKYALPKGYMIHDVTKNSIGFILSATKLVNQNSSSILCFIGIDEQFNDVRWSYKLDMKNYILSNMKYAVEGFDIDSFYLFIPFNFTRSDQFYTNIIKLNPENMRKSKVYGFYGKIQDLKKIDNQHFKISGIVSKDINSNNIAMFYGDLYFDNLGKCPLDTTCLEFDTLRGLTITPVDSVTIEDADISLQDMDIEIDSIIYNIESLSCSFYEYKPTAQFTLLNDTICSSELKNNFVYEGGYFDTSSWKVFLNDSLVSVSSGESLSFNGLNNLAGNLRIDHWLQFDGCEYFYKDSVVLFNTGNASINDVKSSLCPGESTKLYTAHLPSESDKITVNWYNQGQLMGTNDTLIVHNPGIYKARYTNGYCQWTDTITITARVNGCSASIYIPNAFTPNLDNSNDVWKLFSNQPIDAEIEIYDRWGECVYTCSGRHCAWDGTFKQEAMPAGIYVYRIKARLPLSEKVIKKTGTLALLR